MPAIMSWKNWYTALKEEEERAGSGRRWSSWYGHEMQYSGEIKVIFCPVIVWSVFRINFIIFRDLLHYDFMICFIMISFSPVSFPRDLVQNRCQFGFLYLITTIQVFVCIFISEWSVPPKAHTISSVPANSGPAYLSRWTLHSQAPAAHGLMNSDDDRWHGDNIGVWRHDWVSSLRIIIEPLRLRHEEIASRTEGESARETLIGPL